MQDLLTGKKRVEGFKGEWEYKNLSQTCKEVKTGKIRCKCNDRKW